MSASDVLRPDGSDYDPFLFAEVGEDTSGTSVTVLSALARLGLEPWTEARELTRLGQEEAQARLAAHLAAIPDVPALARASATRATKLLSLLPKRSARRAAPSKDTAPKTAARVPVSWGLAVMFVVLAMVWIYNLAHGG